MSELLPCPFCGGEDLEIDHAPTYDVHHPDVYEVHCVECGGRCGEGWTKAEAIAAWNARAERTCHVVSSYFYDDYDIHEFQLSCGHEITMHDAEPPNYCPNCGAKVVDA